MKNIIYKYISLLVISSILCCGCSSKKEGYLIADNESAIKIHRSGTILKESIIESDISMSDEEYKLYMSKLAQNYFNRQKALRRKSDRENNKIIDKEWKKIQKEQQRRKNEVATARVIEAEEKRINTTPNLLTIPSAGISLVVTNGHFIQNEIDAYNCVRCLDWEECFGGRFICAHNTPGRFKTLYTCRVGDIITYVNPDGKARHYKIVSSNWGILHETSKIKDRGILVKYGTNTHFNKGYVINPETNETIFTYNEETMKDDEMTLLTCHKYQDPNGRWIVKAVAID